MKWSTHLYSHPYSHFLPIEPPVVTSVTRTQERVETAFNWRSGRFCAEPTGPVLDSNRPREFWELTQSDK